MAVHKYRVGQTVTFVASRTSMPGSSREYKIVRCLPAEGGQNQYRIKSAAETFERLAKENELSRRSP